MKKEIKQSLVFWLSFTTTVLSVLALIGFVAAQTYVRWKLNQNFTFLGGFELEALTLLALGLMGILTHTHRSDN